MKKLILLVLFCTTVFAQTAQEYSINECIDGRMCVSVVGAAHEPGGPPNTVTLALIGIDVPYNYPDNPVQHQAHGSASRVALITLLQGKTVTFFADRIDDVTGIQTGRMFLDGNDVAVHQLERGLAYPLHNLIDEAYYDLYLAARDRGVSDHLGVWDSGAPYLLPAKYREIINPAGRGGIACPISIEPECEAFANFEAAQFARYCGNRAIDANNDGIACNE